MCAGYPKLIESKAFDVDMESAIYQGFNSNFEDLSLCICISRLQQRDEAKIEKFLERTNQTSVQNKKSKYEILKDLYSERSGAYYEHGLAESLDEDNFPEKLASLEERRKTRIPRFHEWFLNH